MLRAINPEIRNIDDLYRLFRSNILDDGDKDGKMKGKSFA